MSTSPEVSNQHRLLIGMCLHHRIPFYWQGPGLLLISRRRLDYLLKNIKKRGWEVIGLDAFELDGVDIHPRLDLIFDCDRLPGFPSAEETIAVWPEDLWVDVAIGGTLPEVRSDCGGPIRNGANPPD